MDKLSESQGPKTFRLGELFSGPGGIAQGAVEASRLFDGLSIKHEWATDYDADTCATYRKNHGGASANVIWKDVRKLDTASLSAIDGLAFGFPCNDFSAVGERRGIDGKYGPLFQYGINVLQSHKPDWFVAENVSGIRSSNEGASFSMILEKMTAAGYAVVPHLYKFEQYGVPQARHRVIIVGVRNDLPYRFKVPSPAPYHKIDVSSRNAIENPPIPAKAPNHEFTKQSDVVRRRLSHILPGKNAFNSELPEDLRLNIAGATLSHIYKRLDPDKPSYTVTGSGGGGTHVYHWSEDRALTNRERARLQTFPDDYIFVGNKDSVRKQIGMAVPVRGARVIFAALLSCVAGIEYESVEANLSDKLPLIPSAEAAAEIVA
jgi:DNA (cytosine-5)-methyltransferase 1